MTLRGADDKLLASVITNVGDTLPHLKETATTMISAIMEGEVYPVNSDDPWQKYCAVHHTLWNRYGEQVSPFFFLSQD